ncbi:hypothetical protein GE21DRAFT_1346421 [Neurospora crassa]|nr:hypothetical protein B2O8.50 [imported] - Neurospora crassa [Neurospora crassa]KHE78459.1 hypothetical protein GE21DRAFT_1346421 [Neurospora crassa]
MCASTYPILAFVDGIRRAAADHQLSSELQYCVCTYPLGCKAPHPRSGEVFPSMWRFPSPPQPPPLEPCRDRRSRTGINRTANNRPSHSFQTVGFHAITCHQQANNQVKADMTENNANQPDCIPPFCTLLHFTVKWRAVRPLHPLTGTPHWCAAMR